MNPDQASSFLRRLAAAIDQSASTKVATNGLRRLIAAVLGEVSITSIDELPVNHPLNKQDGTYSLLIKGLLGEESFESVMRVKFKDASNPSSLYSESFETVSGPDLGQILPNAPEARAEILDSEAYNRIEAYVHSLVSPRVISSWGERKLHECKETQELRLLR